MPRNRRIDIPGAINHVIIRGIERRDIFHDDIDRNELLARLEKALEKTHCKCLAWVLMPNHFHLLIRTGDRSLSDLMRKVLTGYAIFFNKKHDRHGYLYQNRYKSILCQEDDYLLELIRYIHLNPIRSKEIDNLEDLDNYPWSGHAAIVGKISRSWQSIDEVLMFFSSKRREGIRKYREFIRDGLEMGRREDLMGGGLVRSIGGWEGLKELRQSKESWRGDERILGDSVFVEEVLKKAEEQFKKKEKLLRKGWNIEKLAKKICEEYGITEEELKRKGKKNNKSEARSVFCYLGYRELEIGSKELSQYLGISRAGISQNIEKGEKCIQEKRLNLIT